MSDQTSGMNRRDFLHTAAGAAIGASALGANAAADKDEAKKLIRRNEKPGMTYRRLGRTNFACSRLAAGWRGNNRLKRMLLEAGVNYVDTSRAYVGGKNEAELGELMATYRDKVFLSSKASGLAGYPRLTFKEGEGKKAARIYTQLLEESLKTLKVDHVDCYYLHGVAEPFVLETEEIYAAFEKARKAGKVRHYGFTTHSNVGEVMKKAVEVETKGDIKYDLIMVACNPNSYPGLTDTLAQLQQHDIGLIAMKATGQVRRVKEPRLDAMMKMADDLELNDRERSYAYMMHFTNFDVLISEMQSVGHVEGNLKLPGMKLSKAEARRLRDRVLAEGKDACHHCGSCTAACPERIEVHDILRYHSYYHNYGHSKDACGHVAAMGCDIGRACTDCGKCSEACPAGIDLPAVIRDMARHV